MRRVLALAAAAIALSVAAAGCGGSDSEEDPTAAWASGFCTAVTNWTDDLQSVTSEFTDTSNLSEDGIKSAADDVRSSTQSLVDDLRGLGAPPTDSGDAVKSALDDLSTTLERVRPDGDRERDQLDQHVPLGDGDVVLRRVDDDPERGRQGRAAVGAPGLAGLRRDLQQLAL
jgi:hypothetical protein